MESLSKKNVTEPVYKDNLYPKCTLCKKVPPLGIGEGFLLSGQFICSSCENMILSLSYDDPFYKQMVQQLKNIIYKKR
ncbi:MAG: hypothetical protein GXY91_10410 [Clostridia bacterium]|nr:hypothetical protein [Clostridia bacterium]